MRGDDFDAVGRRFVDAFNRRDAEALVELSDPAIRFYPSTLVGARRRYDGHDGLRRWVADLVAAELEYQVSVREVRPLGPHRFLILSEVHHEAGLVVDSAMIATVEGDRIVEAHSYLTDERMLAELGLISDGPAD